MVWLIGSIIVIAAVFALLWRTSTPPVGAVSPTGTDVTPEVAPADHE